MKNNLFEKVNRQLASVNTAGFDLVEKLKSERGARQVYLGKLENAIAILSVKKEA